MKFHLNHIVSLLFAIAIGSACWAQQSQHSLSFGNPTMEIVNKDYLSITLDGCNAWSNEIGNPQLPTMQWLVNTDENANIEIIATDSMWIELNNDRAIVPAQPSHLKSEPTNDWFINYDLYAQDTLYGAPLIKIESLGYMGTKHLARITIAPIKYNPKRNQLLVYNHLEYRINGYSPRKSAEGEPKYLAVIPQKYATIAKPLMQWRRQLGWHVEEIYISNNNKDSIRETLKNRYQKSPSDTYILLIGGINDIPSFSGRHAVATLDNRYSDMYYGEYTKDWYPEAVVGRLSVDDTTELRQVIEKIIRYEQTPDTLALRKALILAGEEDRNPAPITTNGQVNYAGMQIADRMDTICFRNPESESKKDSIVSTLRNGVGLVNYTSHCLFDQWRRPTIDGNEMDTIAQSVGVWINNCCSSNRFGRNCLGEHLLKNPHGGGVGIIGSVNETFWEEDYYWSIGAKRPIQLNPSYDSLHLGAIDNLLKKETLGEILLAGNLAVTAVGSPYEAFYWEIYCLLGDPATRPYLGETPQVDTTRIESLLIGMNSISMNGTIGACITLMQNEKIVGKCTLNELGWGEMQLTEPLDNSNIIVTTSKAWHRPVIDTLMPQQPHGAYIMITLTTEHNSITMGEQIPIKIICKNVGTDTVKQHQVELIQTNEDSLGAWLTAPWNKMITTLAPNASDTTEITISMATLNEISKLNFHLNANYNNETYYSHKITWNVNRSELNATLNISQLGTQIQQLMPHQPYELNLNITNITPYPIENANATISVKSYPSGNIQLEDYSWAMDGNSEKRLTMAITTEDSLQGLWITTQMNYDGMPQEQNQWWIAGKAHENFENGNLNNYPWMNNSLHPWKIDSNNAHTGKYSLKSGKIDHHERCDISIWIDIPTNDTIGFWNKISSESHKDQLHFYIDNRKCYFTSGIHDWTYWETPIIKGLHKLTWRYQKNDTETMYEDAVWIDNIRLPIATWNIICGTMDTICYENQTAIENIKTENHWKVWPNPAKNSINIQCSKNGKVELWDCLGRKIDTFNIENSTTTQYSITNLRFGMYLLVYINDMGSNAQKLMITP